MRVPRTSAHLRALPRTCRALPRISAHFRALSAHLARTSAHFRALPHTSAHLARTCARFRALPRTSAHFRTLDGALDGMVVYQEILLGDVGSSRCLQAVETACGSAFLCCFHVLPSQLQDFQANMFSTSCWQLQRDQQEFVLPTANMASVASHLSIVSC